MIVRLFLIGTALGGVLCQDNAPGGVKLSGAANEANQGINDKSYTALVSGVQNTGRAGRGIVAAVGSVGNFGLWAIADNSERVKRLFDETLPRHSKQFKDSAFGTLGAAADHLSNANTRLHTGVQEVVKVLDELSATLLEESTKVLKATGETAKSVVKLGGTVGTQTNRVAQTGVNKLEDIVNRPVENLREARKRLSFYRGGAD